jgi:hypothetical protein
MRLVTRLKWSGWSVGSPITADQLEQDTNLRTVYSGQDWEEFKLILRPGDELREVRYKVQHGVAIFRQGVLTATYLPMLVMT